MGQITVGYRDRGADPRTDLVHNLTGIRQLLGDRL